MDAEGLPIARYCRGRHDSCAMLEIGEINKQDSVASKE
jgi:hypothetical protein